MIALLGFTPRSDAQAPTPTPGGPCCTAHDGPGCDEVGCQDCVCAGDPVCCEQGPIGWDANCVNRAILNCPDECQCSLTPVPTPTPGGDCCTARDPEIGGTGCDISPCQECVCGRDDACCNNIWDSTCVNIAQVECATSCPCGPLPTETPGATPTPGGDCCSAHAGANCDASECSACVCALDDVCCNGVWDGNCVAQAQIECAGSCPCGSEGSCCEPHGGPGCNEVGCKECVCDLDEACCDPEIGWDADCVSEALAECAADCSCEAAGSCCESHPETVGCDDSGCQECVCTLDELCCTEGWDETCADQAAMECHSRCAGCGISDCCDLRSGPGCSDDACEACVCEEDDFCCRADGGIWDGGCVDIAVDSCNAECMCEGGSTCPGDCDGVGTVAINELILCVNIALGSQPASACPACDPDGGGTVTINELIAAVNAALNGCP